MTYSYGISDNYWKKQSVVRQISTGREGGLNPALWLVQTEVVRWSLTKAVRIFKRSTRANRQQRRFIYCDCDLLSSSCFLSRQVCGIVLIIDFKACVLFVLIVESNLVPLSSMFANVPEWRVRVEVQKPWLFLIYPLFLLFLLLFFFLFSSLSLFM